MSKDASMTLVILLLLVLLGLMIAGWYARKRRQGHIGAPARPPVDLGETDLRFTGKYVSTTIAGDQLNRVNVHDLGFRSNCLLAVHADGVVVARAGSDDIWISRDELRGISRATWTIDRVVETNGLHVIEWNLAGTAVDSYFRMDDPEACERALNGVVGNERQPK